jgi:hypothetical protein
MAEEPGAVVMCELDVASQGTTLWAGSCVRGGLEERASGRGDRYRVFS